MSSRSISPPGSRRVASADSLKRSRPRGASLDRQPSNRMKCPMKRVRHAKTENADYERVCTICGLKAYNYNYGVICCESCKMFFRRNSWKLDKLTCIQNQPGSCSMNVSIRRKCSACRLKKCLDVGMMRQLNSFEQKVLGQAPPPPQQLSSAPTADSGPLLVVGDASTSGHLETVDINVSGACYCSSVQQDANAPNLPGLSPHDVVAAQFQVHRMPSHDDLLGDPFYQFMLSLLDSSSDSAEIPLTATQISHIDQIEAAATEYITQPFSIERSGYLFEANFDNMLQMTDQVGQKAVLFSRRVQHFQSLALDQKKILLSFRLTPVLAHSYIFTFDFDEKCVMLLMDNGGKQLFDTEVLASILPDKFSPTMRKHSQFIVSIAQIVGPSIRLQALYLSMKMFEMSPKHEELMGPVIHQICLNAYRYYTGLLATCMRAEAGPHFQERWRAFCHLNLWARYELDLGLVAGLKLVLEKPTDTAELLNEVANTLKDLLL